MMILHISALFFVLAALHPSPATADVACEMCEGAFWLIDQLVEGNITERDAAKIASDFCELNGGGLGYKCHGQWQCQDMCTHAVAIFEPEVFEIGTLKFLDPNSDCIKFGYCPANQQQTKSSRQSKRPVASSSSSSSSSFSSNPVKSPEAKLPLKSSAKSAKNDGILRIVQVTDIHMDPNYTPGTWTQCGQPLCCRNVPYSGEVLTPTNIAGTFGDYSCDAPVDLVASLLDALKGIYPPPDFGFLTGDDPPHNVWNQTREYNVGVSKMIGDMFSDAFPNITFFPVLGNHNGFPINQYNINPVADQDWLYFPLAEQYSNWLDEASLETFEQGGFYVAQMSANLQVLVLNTNFHTDDNYWNWLGQGDHAGMMAWTENILSEMRAAGQRTFVLMHHPQVDVYGNFSTYINNLLTSYSDVVIATFYGHTHNDEVFILSDINNNPTLAGYIAGAGTPNGQNPSFRIYDVDAVTGDVIDYFHYRPDLAAQGLINNNSTNAPTPVWNLIYSAREAYNMTTLSAANWNQTATRMINDNNLFEFYYMNYYGGLTNGVYTQAERDSILCSIIGGGTPEGTARCSLGLNQPSPQ